jgi:hypothetical protein
VPTTASARGRQRPGGCRAITRPHQLGDAEGEVERLAGVEARVAERLVAVVELLLEHLLGAAEALGHVLARDLEVDAAGPGADLAMRRRRSPRSRAARRRSGGSCARTASEAVRVHRVAGPDDRDARLAHGASSGGSARDAARRRAGTSVSRPGSRRVEPLAERDELVGVASGPTLTPTGCRRREELDVRAVELPRALADPEEVRRAAYQSPVVESAGTSGSS